MMVIREMKVYISVFYLSEKCRQCEYGTEIVDAMVKYFKSLGKKDVYPHVSLRNATALRC